MIITLNGTHTHETSVRKNIYKTALLSLFDKKKIWDGLNEERLVRQESAEIGKNLLANKKQYILENKKYFKVIGHDREYYIRVDTLNYVSTSQFNVQLCRYTFNGMRSKKGLMKIDKSTNKIYISEDTLRVYFKKYKIELDD